MVGGERFPGATLAQVAEVAKVNLILSVLLSYCGTTQLPSLNVRIMSVCVLQVVTETGLVSGVGPGFTSISPQESSITQSRILTCDIVFPFRFLSAL